MKDLTQTLDTLIDRWCERRAIRPLQLLLLAYPGGLVHTDQKFEVLEALRDVKGLCRTELTEDELRMVIEALNSLEDRLIVEDERDLRELLADVLVVAGHEILKADDGTHAVQVLLDKTPKVLLTDIVMPHMDGIELLRAMKELGSARSGLKIIAISGAPDQSKFLGAAASMGANKILSKPFTRADILNAVEEVLTGEPN